MSVSLKGRLQKLEQARARDAPENCTFFGTIIYLDGSKKDVYCNKDGCLELLKNLSDLIGERTKIKEIVNRTPESYEHSLFNILCQLWEHGPEELE